VRRCVTERRYDAVDRKDTEIGDYVFVGANAVVQMGARIGHHSVIAAGAVLLENAVVPPYSLVAGVPAQVVRDIRVEVETWSQGKP
jgi:acetyltransferase-like isoleucine patch superfamily enzyme